MMNSENNPTLVNILCPVLFKIKNKAYIIYLLTIFNTNKSRNQEEEGGSFCRNSSFTENFRNIYF